MKPRILAGVARIAAVCAIGAAALGSASSQSQYPPPNGSYGAPVAAQPPPPPPPQAMEPARALGLWKSSWGAVKIEEDARGGAPAGVAAVQGVFVYNAQQGEVVGYFSGSLQGNVLQFTWQEPSQPSPLEGAGYLVFDAGGQSFAGRWWTSNRDRSGEWNGWRQQDGGSAPSSSEYPPVPGADSAPRTF